MSLTDAPIDEHALLIAVRQNARIARLAEPLMIFCVGARVDAALYHFILALQMLSRDTVGTIHFGWDDIIFGLSDGGGT
jgi:hypothetical protein